MKNCLNIYVTIYCFAIIKSNNLYLKQIFPAKMLITCLQNQLILCWLSHLATKNGGKVRERGKEEVTTLVGRGWGGTHLLPPMGGVVSTRRATKLARQIYLLNCMNPDLWEVITEATRGEKNSPFVKDFSVKIIIHPVRINMRKGPEVAIAITITVIVTVIKIIVMILI